MLPKFDVSQSRKLRAALSDQRLTVLVLPETNAGRVAGTKLLANFGKRVVEGIVRCRT